MNQSRLNLISDDQMDEGQIAITSSYRRGAGLPNVIRMFAMQLEAFRTFKPFGVYLMSRSSLDSRIRELAILRTAVLNVCDYEWGHHLALGEAAGLTANDFAQLKIGPGAIGWSVLEFAVLNAVDQLCLQRDLDDDAYRSLAAVLSEDQIIDLIFTVGNYTLVAMTLKTFGTALEPGFKSLSDMV